MPMAVFTSSIAACWVVKLHVGRRMEQNTVATTVALLCATIALIYWYVQRTYTYWQRRGVPVLPFRIPFGHFGEVGKTTSHAELMKSIYDRMKRTGAQFVGAYSFHRPIAVILDTELMRKVLISEFSTFHDRGTYHNPKSDPLSASMISIEGQQWREFRLKFTAIFSSGKMKQMFGVTETVTDELVRIVGGAADSSGRAEMKDLLAGYTTDVIGVCGFGLECNSMQGMSDFRRMGKRVFENPRNSPAYQLFISSNQELARFLGCRIFSKEVEKFYTDIVSKTVAYRKANNVKRNDLLDVLCELKDNGFGLTMEQITAEAFAFFLAGFGTTSTMMSFALYELALNETVQSRLRDDIYRVLDKHEGRMDYEALADMQYMNQVFDESLRKYPPFGNLIRIVRRDYKVPGTDHTLEKGTSIWIPTLAIHNDPEYYPNPERFDPDRFTPEAKKTRNPMTYMPFGDGPRICVGIRFAMLKARLAFAKLFTNFEFSVCDETRIPIGIARKTFLYGVEGGVTVTVRRLTDARRRY